MNTWKWYKILYEPPRWISDNYLTLLNQLHFMKTVILKKQNAWLVKWLLWNFLYVLQLLSVSSHSWVSHYCPMSVMVQHLSPILSQCDPAFGTWYLCSSIPTAMIVRKIKMGQLRILPQKGPIWLLPMLYGSFLCMC